MIWFIVMQVLSTLLEWLSLGRETDHQEKDLEILLLRRQLAILERKQDKPVGAKKSIRSKSPMKSGKIRLCIW